MPRVMGTRLDILITAKEKAVAESVWYQVVAEITRLEKMLNRFDAESELAKLNANAANNDVKLSDELWDILTSCKKYYNDTNGLFDITLNDFSAINFNELEKTVSFAKEDLSVDLGAYAKGYALQKLKIIFNENDVAHVFVNFGSSSVMAMGHHPHGDCWSINVENPFQKGHLLHTLELRNNSLSTSGNMPSHTQHIMNPYTKRYNDERKLVCVTANNAVDAEVLSTALMIATDEQAANIKTNFCFDTVKIFNKEI